MLKKSPVRRSAARRGGVLITTLIVSTIVASMLAGVATLLTSYYSRAIDDTNYENAINLAEAGVNYEIRRITANVANADMPGSTTPYGTTVAFGNGSFRVYCTMSDGTTAWDKTTTPFCIISSGVIGSVTRSIKISATSATGSGGSTAVFGIVSGLANGSPTITGSVGTDGTICFNGAVTLNGSVTFNGPGSGWSPTPFGSYSAITSPTAVSWPTVGQIALSHFPNSGATAPGGLTYLSLHNDNLTASPPILLNSILLNGSGTVTLVGKPGGANYYLTSLLMNGNVSFTFNNANGPITVWEGPAGGSGTFTLNGGVSSVKMSQDPTKAVRFYVATTSGVTLNGTSELDAGVYNVTGANSTVTFNGTGDLYGMVICDKFLFNGNPNVIATSGYFSPAGSGVYQYNNSWVETNGM